MNYNQLKAPSTASSVKAAVSVPASVRLPAFEGGQTPIQRRLPKRGFSNAKFKTTFSTINVSTLDAFEAGTVVTPESLVECGKVKQMKNGGVKVLGNGEITKALTVKAHAFSASAKEKIEAAGGTVEVID